MKDLIEVTVTTVAITSMLTDRNILKHSGSRHFTEPHKHSLWRLGGVGWGGTSSPCGGSQVERILFLVLLTSPPVLTSSGIKGQRIKNINHIVTNIMAPALYSFATLGHLFSLCTLHLSSVKQRQSNQSNWGHLTRIAGI